MIKGTVTKTGDHWRARLEDDETHQALVAGDSTEELARGRVLALWAQSVREDARTITVEWEGS